MGMVLGMIYLPFALLVLIMLIVRPRRKKLFCLAGLAAGYLLSLGVRWYYSLDLPMRDAVFMQIGTYPFLAVGCMIVLDIWDRFKKYDKN